MPVYRILTEFMTMSTDNIPVLTIITVYILKEHVEYIYKYRINGDSLNRHNTEHLQYAVNLNTYRVPVHVSINRTFTV